MQQHPVPQNVTQYQFRLVGDMTLKQFLELAGGMVVAYLFFASNLLFFIKWPLALGSLLLGVGLAFFPIEERPLDVWIINFLKSIYAPTRFVWKKTTLLPALFNFKPHEVLEKKTSTKTVKAPTLPTNTSPTTDYSKEEAAKIKSLENILTQLEPIAQKIKPTSPKLKVPKKPQIAVRKLSSNNVIFETKTPLKSPPPTKSKPSPTKDQHTNKNISIPTNKSVSIPITKKKDTTPPPPPTQTIFTSKPTVSTPTPTQPATKPVETIKLPASPKKPNIVVGMVVDKNGKIVNGAIVEIITEDSIPARAIKANSLGQFYISTPLAPGNYIIEVDADGLTFPNQSLHVNDNLISPIILRAS